MVSIAYSFHHSCLGTNGQHNNDDSETSQQHIHQNIKRSHEGSCKFCGPFCFTNKTTTTPQETYLLCLHRSLHRQLPWRETEKGEGLSLAIQPGSCSTNESGPASIWLRCIKTRQMMVREIVNPQKLSKNICVPAGNLTTQSYCLSWGQCQLFVQQWQRHAGCFPVNIPAVNDGPESIELSCVNTGMLKFQFPGGLGFTNFDLWWHVVPVHI